MNIKASVSHDDVMRKKLPTNSRFAAEYMRASFEDTDDPKALLIALRRITEARGGFVKIAKASGIERERLHRALGPRGNPRLSTLVAATKAVGLKLTVELPNTTAIRKLPPASRRRTIRATPKLPKGVPEAA